MATVIYKLKKQRLYGQKEQVSGSIFTDQPPQTIDVFFCSVEDDRQCQVITSYFSCDYVTAKGQSSVLAYRANVVIAFVS